MLSLSLSLMRGACIRRIMFASGGLFDQCVTRERYETCDERAVGHDTQRLGGKADEEDYTLGGRPHVLIYHILIQRQVKK